MLVQPLELITFQSLISWMLNISLMLPLVHQVKHSQWSQIQDHQIFGFIPVVAGLLHAGLIVPITAKKSSTYVADGSAFKIEYGSGGISGTVSYDKATIGKDITVPKMGFGEVTSVSGISFLASKMCGILGFGYNTISVDKLDTFMDLEASTKEKSFSMYLHSNPTASYMMIPGW